MQFSLARSFLSHGLSGVGLGRCFDVGSAEEEVAIIFQRKVEKYS
jgi:hypothetical protein